MPGRAPHRPFVPALLLLFVGSGCAALIYEVVWFQLLRFAIGASMVSLGILLASFMGGMFLGSLFFDRFVPLSRHPLRVYALLELGIAALGAVLPLLLPQVATVYASFAGYGTANVLLRGLLCALCLLPPAILMGATLPAIARWMETTRVGVSRIGLFYGANTAGGVIGTLLASFHLLRHHDVLVASAWAVALNLAAALIATGIARIEPGSPAAREAAGRTSGGDRGDGWRPRLAPHWIHLVIGISGLTALGAQVVWTRLLALLLGATVYSFSLILAVFLTGMGLGAAAGAIAARRAPDVAAALAACQALLVLGVAFAGWAIPELLPGLHFVPPDASWMLQRGNDLLRCAVAILPATLCWGASFPLAIACIARERRDLGRTTGRVYASNTAGAILGALLFSMVVIPAVGSHASQQVLAGLSGASVLCVLIPLLAASGGRARPRPAAAAVALLAVLVVAGAAVRSIPKLPVGLVTSGRLVSDWDVDYDVFELVEGVNATVATTREAETGYRNLHVGGKVVASTYPNDMRIQRMLGHLPALLHPDPRSVLVVGFGTGVTAGSFVLHPEVERITIVEIEPEVPALAEEFFAGENHRVLDDPRTRIVFDDARHFIATTDETFDVITSDPIHPWMKGSAALYTREYYELVQERLNAGGVVAQWVPFYETSEPAVKSELATFLSAFPRGTIWSTLEPGQGYDVTLIGRTEPAPIRADAIQRRLDASPRVRASLSVVGIHDAVDLLSAFAGQKDDVEGWLADAELNVDWNLRLEYLAGEALDLQMADTIVRRMAGRLAYPSQLFVVNGEQELALRRTLHRHAR